MSSESTGSETRYPNRWKPGQSGNPGGRTKKQREVEQEIERLHCGQHVLDALERLREIGMGYEIEHRREGGEVVVAYTQTKVQVQALLAFIERVQGPPPKHAQDDDGSLKDLGAEELEELSSKLREMAEAKRGEVS